MKRSAPGWRDRGGEIRPARMKPAKLSALAGSPAPRRHVLPPFLNPQAKGIGPSARRCRSGNDLFTPASGDGRLACPRALIPMGEYRLRRSPCALGVDRLAG